MPSVAARLWLHVTAVLLRLSSPLQPSRRTFARALGGGILLPTAFATAAAAPKLYGTRSGILYSDAATSAAAERPPREDGERVVVAFTVWRGGFDAEILETGTCVFVLGDNSANDAVDELARTLPFGSSRRAAVPASFRFDPDRPGAPTYLQLRLQHKAPRSDRCANGNAASAVVRPRPRT